jgi:hypothetical protein
MKPILFNKTNQRRSFPLTDFNYQSIDLDDCGARCAGFPSYSFHSISRDYFRNESPRAFGIESIIYGLFAVTTMPALIDTARAVFHLLRAIA